MKQNGEAERTHGKEKTAVFSRSCAPWTLNLGPQTLVWSQPAPEGVDMAWNSLLKWVFNELEVWESILRPYNPQRVVGGWSFIYRVRFVFWHTLVRPWNHPCHLQLLST